MKVDLITPEFLLCETPVKTDSFHDHRVWIYATQALSLIEFVSVDEMEDFKLNKDFTYFNYKNSEGIRESYLGVFTQNNCERTENDEKKVLDAAWKVFTQYLDQIDSYEDF